jgi:hypothetical protein
MMRNSEVPQVMTMVEAALFRAAAPGGPEGPIFLTPEAAATDIARLRHRATVQIEVFSGSDRPGIGPVIVMAKRAVRRGLRWYLKPAFEQQSSFNHAVLDLLERAGLENEKLREEMDRLRPHVRPDGPGRRVDDRAGTTRE